MAGSVAACSRVRSTPQVFFTARQQEGINVSSGNSSLGRSRGGQQPISHYLSDLGLPPDFLQRDGVPGQDFQAAAIWLENSRPARQAHWPALVLAFLAQAEELLGREQKDSVVRVFDRYPPETSTSTGGPVNTLNFPLSNTTVRLRKTYNDVLLVITNSMLRQHPSNAPHATQSWPAYRPLIELIYEMAPHERAALAAWVWDVGVLSAPERRMAAAQVRVARPFERVLEHMPTSSKPAGALFQALAYGYLRADSPNLILESHSVNTSAKRAAMLGDVDGFRGAEPELAAEVKDRDLTSETIDVELGNFFRDITEAPNVTPIVICRSITDDARRAVERLGVTVLDKETMRRTVAVWDLPKQQEALRGVDYYLSRIQKSPALAEAFRAWLAQNRLDTSLGAPDATADDDEG